MQKIVILGGGYGGVLAATRLAASVPVTLVDASDGLVERIRLHQVAAGDDIAPVPYDRLFRKLPVTFTQARVLSIDRKHRLVHTSAGDVRYDKLVYALGSTIDLDSVPGARENSLSLRGIDAAMEIRERLKSARRVIIAGGGLTAVEMAAEIAERHAAIAVTIVSANGVGPRLSEGGSQYLRNVLARLGVEVRDGSRVIAVRHDGVVLESEERLEADLVIWCGGFRASPIAREAGLQVNAVGQIVVDDHLRSSDPDIHAIGDAAAFRNLGMQCATAMPMGAWVADFLAGDTDGPFSFSYALTCISLGRGDGIVQLKYADDTPRERFISGRAGAWTKELVCRFTLMSVRMERLGVPYWWPKTIAA